MNIYIVIPAHNEQGTIGLMLESLENQTLLPKKVVVVNDNSSDDTQRIIEGFASRHQWLVAMNHSSSQEHIPGSKVINAFYKGYDMLDEHYDIICKFDADIILPKDYLENIIRLFESDDTIGIAGGHAYIEKDNIWIYETVASKNHVRGPFKAYRKQCFKDIGGLKRSIGWDTLDTLLAQYHGWKVQTDKTLHVKHLKPTGQTYTSKSKYLQGEALFKMRYGFSLMFLTALKSGFNKKSLSYVLNTISGYNKARKAKITPLVSTEEGKFIRKLRWKGVKESIGLKIH
jgi:cellulose synthase/poly-beta-1,6-N-acetylglucosamine synthase-like glycosyltransferase